MIAPDVLKDGIAALGLNLDDAQLAQLSAFAAQLEKWNRVYNLTALREPSEILTHHLLDSLAIVPHIPLGPLLDVGTGGGFPGVPIAIAQSARKVSLLDSSDKKTAFLRQIKGLIPLDNVSVYCHRVEDWEAPATYGVIVSRAFSSLRVFVERCARLLQPGGTLLAMKGAVPEDEIAALPAGFRVRDIVHLRVPGLDAQRHLLSIEAV